MCWMSLSASLPEQVLVEDLHSAGESQKQVMSDYLADEGPNIYE